MRLPTLFVPACLILALGATAIAGSFPDPVGATAAKNSRNSPAGRVLVRSGGGTYIGTGCALASKSVLTAGHMLYDPDAGWSTRVRYEYGRYGSSIISTNRARTLYILGGYRKRANTYGGDSRRAFARDMAGFRTDPIAGLQSVAGWATNGLQLLASDLPKVSLGYGAEYHDGETLLASDSTAPFNSLKGPYYFNSTYYIESGMSGGPLLVQTSSGWFIAGVNVSGATSGAGVGVRGIDDMATTFIDTYLSR